MGDDPGTDRFAIAYDFAHDSRSAVRKMTQGRRREKECSFV